jgi:4-amino-4-deoxy-L-arabinose transferase-like glycosyltransferase
MTPAKLQSDTTSWLSRPWISVLGLALLALLFRLPFLQHIPSFIESNELRITLDLYSGRHFPLNDFRPYLGALNNYITAICFHIAGLHYWIPRTIPLLAGSATVGLLFLLGKKLFDAHTAAIASVMMASSAYPVFFLSHVAWPNSLTPFFSTGSLLCFVLALEDRKPWLLPAAAFLFALALQTHPSMVTLAPALLLIFALQGKDRLFFWLRKPVTYLTIPAAALGYANMIYYNVIHRLATPETGLSKARYAVEQDRTFAAYFSNLESAWLLLLRLLAGAVPDRDTPIEYLYNPVFFLCTMALLAGLYLCIRRRKWALPLMLVPMFVIPFFNGAYDFYNFGRYLGFLIPMACIGAAMGFRESMVALDRRFPNWKPAVLVLSFCLLAGYVGSQIAELAAAYGRFELTGNNAEMYEQVRESLEGFDRKNTIVAFDTLAVKATPIKVYLETDGWTVDGDPGSARRTRKLGSQQLLQMWNTRLETLRASTSTLVAVLSPRSLEPFLHTKHHYCPNVSW